MQALIEYQDAYSCITNMLVQEYGNMNACYGAYQMPFEFFASGLHGLKNTSLDLRRHGQEMLDAMEAIDERNWKGYTSYAPYIKNDGTYVFDTYTCPWRTRCSARSSLKSSTGRG